MDMFYATIHVLGEQRSLYRENRLEYVISIPKHLENHHIYSLETYLGSSIFFNDVSNEQHDYEEILK